jgi:hypothetical protein
VTRHGQQPAAPPVIRSADPAPSSRVIDEHPPLRPVSFAARRTSLTDIQTASCVDFLQTDVPFNQREDAGWRPS